MAGELGLSVERPGEGKRSRPDRLPRPEELGKEGPLWREMA